jgi:hypothetical protein
LRVLPDFLILGAARGGTTSLFNYLAGHPQVAADVKEIHYFDNQYSKGPRWYRSFFPMKSYLAAKGARLGAPIVTGEASPYYLFHPAVPQRVQELIPSARFLVLLRDPVTRAYSEYRLRVRGGFENLSFAEAIDAEAERLSGWNARLGAGEQPPSKSPHQMFSYAARGEYASQLERWFDYFPRDAFLIERSENFFSDPATVLHRAEAFLGLDPWDPPEYTAFNSASEPPPDDVTRDLLRERFEGLNADLERLLGIEGFTAPWA